MSECRCDDALICYFPSHLQLFISVIFGIFTITRVLGVVASSRRRAIRQGIIVGLRSDLNFLAGGLRFRQLGLWRFRWIAVLVLVVKEKLNDVFAVLVV